MTAAPEDIELGGKRHRADTGICHRLGLEAARDAAVLISTFDCT